MKFDAFLTVGGAEYKIIRYDIALLLSGAGQATFEVQAPSKPTGAAVFIGGYTVGQSHTVFQGYVEKATLKYDQHWVLFCREIAHVMQIPLAMSLRRCFLRDVLGEMQAATALTFIPGGGPYASKQATRFFSIEKSDVYYSLKRTERVFGIEDFVWFQTVRAEIWLGAWKDCIYASNGDIRIDPLLMTQQKPHSVKLPIMPALRPGMVLNGHRLLHVRHTSDHVTRLRWKSS